ncbi:porin [Phaeovulum vinaykumarii]|uniref:Outer membrane protein OmpU n=1 Tax=Phaeovulum vinaykumarii TaxID=407234 RepID=A0A1N7KQ93_9RHOB|nr:porin [Phaeovulum vinaykumarii]SIS63747.1 outer membrane protein OmpU [Phaeovulum vinaykumarii]SOC01807.1 outer membrane protein OmpU [Phaeovulum vinaykumarii]
MKKLLLASTALVMTAGVASAEMTIGGSAEMGFQGGDFYGVGTDDLSFHQDYSIDIKGTGTTDAGLEFGFTFSLQGDGNVRTRNDIAGDNETVFIGGAFGKLTMGDTDGAFDWAMTEVNLAGGSIADDETTHGGFNGNAAFDGQNDDQVLRYEYAMGAFGFALSYEQFAQGQSVPGVDADDSIGVGLKYSTQMSTVALDFGLGYQQGAATAIGPYTLVSRTNGDVIGASVKADFGNGFLAGLNYSSYDFEARDVTGVLTNTPDATHMGLGVAYTTGPWTVAANYGKYDVDAVNADVTGYGLVVNYDLGGGAVVQAGYGATDFEAPAANDTESYSIGVAMSF